MGRVRKGYVVDPLDRQAGLPFWTRDNPIYIILAHVCASQMICKLLDIDSTCRCLRLIARDPYLWSLPKETREPFSWEYQIVERFLREPGTSRLWVGSGGEG